MMAFSGSCLLYGSLLPHLHTVDVLEEYFVLGAFRDLAIDLFAKGIIVHMVSIGAGSICFHTHLFFFFLIKKKLELRQQLTDGRRLVSGAFISDARWTMRQVQLCSSLFFFPVRDCAYCAFL